jgi:hypothetical protein
VHPILIGFLRCTNESHEQIPHLLWKILHGGDVKAADAKRLHQAAAAGALAILDLESPQSADTTEMIQRVSIHPVMLQTAEGRRCIAIFFDQGPSMVQKLMSTMRNQIQMGKDWILDAYGAYSKLRWMIMPLIASLQLSCYPLFSSISEK